MLIILLSGDIDEDEPNIQQAVLGTAAVASGILDTVEEPLGSADDDIALQHIVVAGLGHIHPARLPQVGLVLEVQEEMQ